MRRPDQIIAAGVLALLVIGVVMVNSAGMSLDEDVTVTPTSIMLSRSSAYMLLAIGAFFIGWLLPARTLLNLGTNQTLPIRSGLRGPGLRLVLAGGLLVGVLALVYVPGLGHEANASHRWLNVNAGSFTLSMQPSEIAKWALILLLARYAALKGPAMARWFGGLFPALVTLGAVSAFIVVEDLGTGVLIAAAGAIILIAGGARIWQFALLAPIGLAAITGAIVTSPYRLRRLTAFMDPWHDPQGAGYHMIQSMTAVASGAGAGRGLGHGVQKFGYLPEDRTDFLFSIICEELGVVGAGVVVALYLLVFAAIAHTALRQTEITPRLVCLGVLVTMGLQTLINLFVVTGLGPTKGIALPLLSSGGTGWILTAGSLGLVASLARSSAEAPVPKVEFDPRPEPAAA